MNICIRVLVGLLTANALSHAATPRLLTVSPADDILREIDPNTGATLSTINMAITGSTSVITQGHGLAVDPTNGSLYAMVSLLGQSAKELLQVDPATGACIDIGNTLEKFAGITFDSSGQLWGISGDGGFVSEALYKIDKSTAVSTLVIQLGNGSVGESIAFNPFDGKLYHGSGLGAINDPLNGQILETVDPVTLAVTPVTLSGGPRNGLQCLARLDATTLYSVDFTPTLLEISTSGVVTAVGTLDHLAKGIAWFDGPGQFTKYGNGCPGSGAFVPTLDGGGIPNAGSAISLSVGQALGGSQALLFFGLGTGSVPLNPSCALQVMPILPQLVIPLPMIGAGAGGGGITLPGVIPSNITPIDIFLQVLVGDPGAAGGVASTRPLRMHIQ